MKKRKTRMMAVNRLTHEKILVNPEDERDVYWSLDKRHWDIMIKGEDRKPKVYTTRKPRSRMDPPINHLDTSRSSGAPDHARG